MLTLEPIGTFHSESKYPYEAPRQGTAEHERSLGEVRLLPHRGFEQALEDLEGFERIWIIYQFHHNQGWKPKVQPPRGARIKRGVFATRAPYRPNAIGLSCVRLVRAEGLCIVVEEHDLLNGTPVLDIKPYLPYADAFPEAKVGWLEDIESERWQQELSELARLQAEWLEQNGLTKLKSFIKSQLEFDPLDAKRKRVRPEGGSYLLAYRTWRIRFTAAEATRSIEVRSISSGYSAAELMDSADVYTDKELHRQFLIKWPGVL